MIEFGEQPFKGYCWCGLELLADGGCPKYHKKVKPKKERRINPDFSGKSKSVNKYNEYND